MTNPDDEVREAIKSLQERCVLGERDHTGRVTVNPADVAKVGAFAARQLAAIFPDDKLRCRDCGLLYSGDAWCDVVIPDEIWKQIAPEDGVLCFNCIAHRCVSAGIDEVPAAITSGPFVVLKSDEPGVRWFFRDPLGEP